ncbi:polysaccharide deacetylase family protein [Effusibacillus consociatus]|uniref:Polysaccharide deacetylase family protein n=1 Tax=Effusibacillus consociatus TaxID=1117041 RepID=A0ABV9Q7C2_9BACL
MKKLFLAGVLLFSVGCTPGVNKSVQQDLRPTTVVQTSSVSQPATVAPAAVPEESKTPEPAVKPADTAVKTVEKAVAKSIPILMYHSISDNPKNLLCLSPKRFAEHMQHLKDAGYNTITFRDLEDWEAGKPIPVKPVLITLDDGYRDNYTDAYPVLKQLNLKATIFMTTGFFNQRMNLTEDMAKEMMGSGLIEFGSHTVSHGDLTTQTDERLHSEIIESKLELESKLGVPITAFCYPAGRFNEKTLSYVKQAGYRLAVTTRPGWAELSQGVHTLHRIRINGDLTTEQFKKMLP